jgi:hypothetical protein
MIASKLSTKFSNSYHGILMFYNLQNQSITYARFYDSFDINGPSLEQLPLFGFGNMWRIGQKCYYKDEFIGVYPNSVRAGIEKQANWTRIQKFKYGENNGQIKYFGCSGLFEEDVVQREFKLYVKDYFKCKNGIVRKI